MSNAALAQFNGVPDVYIIIRGLRFIIETKDNLLEHTLTPQLEDRVTKNLCEVAVGIVYPTEVVADYLSMPSPKKVEERLLNSSLKVTAYGSCGLLVRSLINPTFTKLQQLPELLYSISHRAMPESEMREVIETVRNSITNFAKGINALGNAEALSKQIEEVLEV
jgi:hypothetical protein